jgi:hypothetical protein
LPDAQVLEVLNHRRAGGGTRATSRRAKGDKNTITRPLALAGAQAESLPEELGALSPRTREVQIDEKGGFVAQQEAAGEPRDSLDRRRGDAWDHTAVDPESRLLWALVPGQRDSDPGKRLIQPVYDRTAGRTDGRITSAEQAPYELAIREVYGREPPQPRRPGPGRRPKPRTVMPPDLGAATVSTRREKGRVVEGVRTLVFGTLAWLPAFLGRSSVRPTFTTSFVARPTGTDRPRNGRKHRPTSGFSQGLDLHHAASSFIGSSAKFCWCVRTVRIRGGDGHWQQRTPAMIAGLTDHVWSPWEGLTYPAKPS